MSGYPTPYKGLPDPEKKEQPVPRIVEIIEQTEIQPTLVERRGKAWYKNLSLSIKSNVKSTRSSTLPESPGFQVISKEEYLNKPLPALPSPQQQPYFEYMFVDAGIKEENSDELMKSSVETDGNAQDLDQQDTTQTQATNSNGSSPSYGLNSTEITSFAFAQAGVNVSAKEIIDNHFAALGTSLQGNLDLGTLAEDIEKENASADFFGGIKVREAPSPEHLPVVDEDGFVDRREGLEDWPQLWRTDKRTLADYAVPGTENFSVQHGNMSIDSNSNTNGDKPILQPKSQKNKVRILDPSFPESYQTTTTITAPAVQPLVPAPRPLTIRKRDKSFTQGHSRSLSKAHRVNKRGARDSFVTKSTVISPNPDDYSINLLTTKKIRVTETLADQDPSSPSRAVSVAGSITSPSSVDLTATSPSDADTELTDAPALDTDNSSCLSLKRKTLTGDLTGYPGQFESYESDYLHTRATEGPKETHTCGDFNHPNGLFTHTNFVSDPTWPAMEYTRFTLDMLPVRDMSLMHAHNMTLSHSLSQDITAERTIVQEMLRREVHLECASARLEGVGIGQYRYYQGFMSLEEYVGARMCVCAGCCWCSKLCSRYGDVMCPCSEWIVVHED